MPEIIHPLSAIKLEDEKPMLCLNCFSKVYWWLMVAPIGSSIEDRKFLKCEGCREKKAILVEELITKIEKCSGLFNVIEEDEQS
jgi:hypothetical protein